MNETRGVAVLNTMGLRYVLDELDNDETRIYFYDREGKSIVVKCKYEEMIRRWHKWRHASPSVHIQEAFDNLSNEEREFLITGLTPNEWNKIFNPDNEEY